jgi:hypothetical protein
MWILKIIDHIAYAWKPRYYPLSVLSDSLRSHVPRQHYTTPPLVCTWMASAAPDVSLSRANAAWTFVVSDVSFVSSLSDAALWVGAGAFVCATTQGANDTVLAIADNPRMKRHLLFIEPLVGQFQGADSVPVIQR